MIRALALAALLSSASCATVGSAAKACASDPAIVTDVTGALGAPDYVQRLEAIAARVGLCVVNRTVEAVIAPSGAKLDPVVVEHGRAWLAAHGELVANL